MKKLLSLVLVLILALSAVSAFAEETEADVTEIQKYGNLVLSLKGSELLEAGYTYGDITTVTINGNEYEMPVGSNYSDVDQGSMICRVVIKPDTNLSYEWRQGIRKGSRRQRRSFRRNIRFMVQLL